MLQTIRSTAVAAGLLLGAFVGFTAPANAATITATTATLGVGDVGTSWQVDFVCSAAMPCNDGSGVPVGTLSGRAVFTLTSVVSNVSGVNWGISLVLTNTSAASVAGFIASMGFSTDPNATMSTVVDSALDGIVFKRNTGQISGQYQTELCVTVGNGCTNAGSEHDMTPGVSDSMSFVLTTIATSSLTFSDYAMKFQGNPNSFEMGGSTPSPVPLPAAGGLLLAGLAGLAFLKRKQRSL